MTTWSMGQQPAAHRLMDGSPSPTGEDRTLVQRTVVSFEDEWGQTTTTAADVATSLTAVEDVLDSAATATRSGTATVG